MAVVLSTLWSVAALEQKHRQQWMSLRQTSSAFSQLLTGIQVDVLRHMPGLFSRRRMSQKQQKKEKLNACRGMELEATLDIQTAKVWPSRFG